jgi:CII-binding regulator of phage lambda lysogenization HflD
MAKSGSKSKSAFDTLVESVTRIRAEAKERVSEDEFRQMEEKVHQLANKVRASRGRKRETA